jgi:ABC-type sugar transport system permease subunit
MATGVAQRRQPAAAPAVAGRSRLREDLIGWSFAAPFVILFGLFLAGPILASFLLSFTSFGLRDLRNPIGASFIGLDN